MTAGRGWTCSRRQTGRFGTFWIHRNLVPSADRAEELQQVQEKESRRSYLPLIRCPRYCEPGLLSAVVINTYASDVNATKESVNTQIATVKANKYAQYEEYQAAQHYR